MDITLENTGNNTATIKIAMVQEDYQKNVDVKLKDIQKRAVMHGFRPGKVPLDLIKKMHGPAVMAEEVNKVLSESLYNYLQESKLDIIGHPIENPDKNEKVDIETQKDFSFHFDIGLVPDFSLALNNTEVDYYDIRVKEEDIDEQEESLRGKYGTSVEADDAQEDDVISGTITELDHEGNPKAGGIIHKTFITPKYIKDEAERSKFLGLKKGNTLIFNPVKAVDNEHEVASMLNINKEEVSGLQSDFSFVAEEISRIHPAETNADFFSKVYPDGTVETYEDFRERIKTDLKDYYQKESDRFFSHSALEQLVDETEMNLPDGFLKRWLLETDRNLTEDIVNSNFDKYARNFRQELVIARISRIYKLYVGDDEVRHYISFWFGVHSPADAEDKETQAKVKAFTDKFMENEDETHRIRNILFERKLWETLRNNLKVKVTEFTYPEFTEIVMEHHKIKHHEH
ncbi:MAG: hypothetical protein JXA03_10435 [Bacteroidales bacterium]|nr:hypothetical protein [Bacteroidales bacterium]